MEIAMVVLLVILSPIIFVVAYGILWFLWNMFLLAVDLFLSITDI